MTDCFQQMIEDQFDMLYREAVRFVFVDDVANDMSVFDRSAQPEA